MKKHKPFTRESLLEEYVTKGYVNWPRMLATAEALDEALAALRKAEQGVAEVLKATEPVAAPVVTQDDVLTLDEAAQALGVARRSIERWEWEGKATLCRSGIPVRGVRVFMQRAEFDRVKAWRESLP